MNEKTHEELQKEIQAHEDALYDLLEMSKMYSGHQFNLRLNNMIIMRFADLAEKLKLKQKE